MVRFLVKRNSRKSHTAYVLRQFLEYTLPSTGVTYFSGVLFATAHSALLGMRSRGQLLSKTIIEYTNDEYCDMLLSIGTCNGRADIAAWDLVDVIQMLVCLDDWSRVDETGSVTPTALLNGTVRTPANKDTTIVAVERELWIGSRNIARENLDYPNRGSSKYFMMITCIHITTRAARLCFQTIGHYGCNFVNGCVINTPSLSSLCIINILRTDEARFTREGVFSVHNNDLSARDNPNVISNVCCHVSSVSAFGLKSSAALSWTPICDLTG
jgi:hypothetical protein